MNIQIKERLDEIKAENPSEIEIRYLTLIFRTDKDIQDFMKGMKELGYIPSLENIKPEYRDEVANWKKVLPRQTYIKVGD